MRTIRDEVGDTDDVAIENVHAIAGSAKAVLCIIEGEEHWIPKSQITDDSEVYERGHEGKLVITHWLAQQLGWAS